MLLLTKPFLYMYDPHHLRRNDRRYFTRKGQIIQAKSIDPPFTIERNKIEAYKKYIINNGLIETNFKLSGIDFVYNSEAEASILFSEFIYITGPGSINLGSGLNCIILISETPNEYYIQPFLSNSLSTPVGEGFVGWYAFMTSADTSTNDVVTI